MATVVKIFAQILKVQRCCIILPQSVQNSLLTGCTTQKSRVVTSMMNYRTEQKCPLGAARLSQTSQVRFYSKSQDKGVKQKGKKGIHNHHPDVSAEEVAQFINSEHMHKQMNHAIDVLKDEYVKNLTLRTNAAAFETLHVDVDGEKFMINEVAQIGRKGGQTIVLNFSDFPTAIPSALKALQASGIGANPQQEGTTLYIPIPKVTTEHREALSKSAKTLFNKTKVVIQDIQNKYIRDAKKHTEKPADTLHAVLQKVHAVAEDYIARAEAMMAEKQQELLGK